jgi:YggT family protein
MQIIRSLLSLYVFVLIIDAILSYFPDFNQKTWRVNIKRAADFTCDPIRKKLPPMHLPIDISPIMVICLIEILKFLW